MPDKDVSILRELAKKYAEIAADGAEDVKRAKWRDLNSLKSVPPPIYVRAFAWNEMPESRLQCEAPLFRTCENQLRAEILRSSFGDDSVFEPWVTLPAVHAGGGWGVETVRNYAEGHEDGGAYKCDYPLKNLEDIEKLRAPRHKIDEAATRENFDRLNNAIGDIIEVNLDRGPALRNFGGDISTTLGHLRGIENIMLDMMENPEWLHRLLKFLGDAVLKDHDDAEKAGDFGMANHYNQAMPYSHELADPKANARGVKRKELWCFLAAQEYTCVSPDMHREFLLRYQLPIIGNFGLCAYGCCEDLANKIGMLREIPNLRRIAVSPFANVKKCAGQIGRDYVASYRPSPADMVGYDFNPDRIESILKRDFEFLRGCVFDITLKDVETVQGDPSRIKKWVGLTRLCADKYFRPE